MAHKLFFIIIFVGILGILFADTIPGGDVSGTWYAANSPYCINGNITVQTNDTLTIEPGVDVIFLGYYQFSIVGVLEAVGSASDSISFQPVDTLTGWQSLRFSSQKVSHLYYCDIRYAYSSGIQLITAKNVYISHCTVAHCYSNFRGGGIFLDLQANLRLSNSIIENNTAEAGSGGKGGGICIWNCDSALIDSCIIRDNRALISIYTEHYPYDSLPEGGGIFARRGIDAHTLITNCVITGNQVMLSNGDFAGLARGGGMYIGCHDAIVTGCVVQNNVVKGNNYGYGGEMMDGSGIYLDSEGGSYSAQVSYCDISRNLATSVGALHVRTDSVTISNCTFFGNTSMYGPWGHAIYVNDDYGIGMDIANSIIAYNKNGIYGQSTVCRYSDIYQDSCSNMASGFGVLDTVNDNGDSCDVYYNIFMDPILLDTANTNLHLSAGSPCIDAGDPASPYDPDSTIADMGCYFFDQRVPNIALSTTWLDFGSVTVWQSADLPLVIYNLGNADLLIYDIFNNLAVFTTDWNPMDSVIMPNDSLELMVTFTPDDTLLFSDTLWIDNNDTLCYAMLAGMGLPTGITEGALTVPKEFSLRQPLPNPCKSFTLIRFELPKASLVNLSVYDVSGRLVSELTNGLYEAGIHEARLDASGLSAGVYFYCLNTAEFKAVRKVIVAQ